MSNPTPERIMRDRHNRPYFLWDLDLTESQFREAISSDDRTVRSAMVGKLMRQAKPDDVFIYVSEPEVRSLWPEVVPYLGHSKAFWEWILATWAALDEH